MRSSGKVIEIVGQLEMVNAVDLQKVNSILLYDY